MLGEPASERVEHRVTPASPGQVADAVAEDGPGTCRHGYPYGGDVEILARSQQHRRHQDHLAGQGEAHALEPDHQSDQDVDNDGGDADQEGVDAHRLTDSAQIHDVEALAQPALAETERLGHAAAPAAQEAVQLIATVSGLRLMSPQS